ncbi:hypothetical protein [Metabacillus halosaccharovorans]|uniref:hypothetical protein n=1 Tax=Metabacillus halosaccharovorans TaxID=930124 RepID=UPI0009953D7A|nr:hypothetical protein [Metabacillus halosaccharovorans]
MSIKIIPIMWGTKKRLIKDLVEQEIHTVQKIFEQGSYVSQWDGRGVDKKYVYRCFTDGDLPPNGIKDNDKIQTIRIQGNNDVVGLLTTYQDYPNPKTMYITNLYIDLEY